MKAWIKGGLWGLLIGVVLSIIFYMLLYISPILATPLYFLTFPVRFLDSIILTIIGPFFTGAVGISRALLWIIELPLEGLIIGIIIGLIVGGLKKK